jgi:hypothetical protein
MTCGRQPLVGVICIKFKGVGHRDYSRATRPTIPHLKSMDIAAIESHQTCKLVTGKCTYFPISPQTLSERSIKVRIHALNFSLTVIDLSMAVGNFN